MAQVQEALEENEDFHKFRQDLMHRLDIVTSMDKAIHARNLDRAMRIRDQEKYKRYKFNPRRHKPSFIEDEFAEFRTEEVD